MRPARAGFSRNARHVTKLTNGTPLAGAGGRLVDGVANLQLEPMEVGGTGLVTHVRYRVIR